MTTVTITFNPSDPRDVALAAEHVARFADTPAQLPAATATEPKDGAKLLRDRVTALVRGYGEGRHRYLRLIASASPEPARYADIEALFDSPKAIGGTHSSIERSWRSMGAEGAIIDTDMHGNSRMDPAIARVVLAVLEEHPA